MSDDEPVERRTVSPPVPATKAERAALMVRHPAGASGLTATALIGAFAAAYQMGLFDRSPKSHEPPPAPIVQPCDLAALEKRVGDLAYEMDRLTKRLGGRGDDIERKLDNLTTDQVQRFIYYAQDNDKAVQRWCKP